VLGLKSSQDGLGHRLTELVWTEGRAESIWVER